MCADAFRARWMLTMSMNPRHLPILTAGSLALIVLTALCGMPVHSEGDVPDPCERRVAAANREAEVAWSHFNQVAAETGRLREQVRESERQVLDQAKQVDDAQRDTRAAERALADALG